MLNSAALAMIGGGDFPDCVERDEVGATDRPDLAWGTHGCARPTQRCAPRRWPPIGREARRLRRDRRDRRQARRTMRGAIALLNTAAASGSLPQRIMMMSAGPIQPPRDGAVRPGPVKILLDENDLPDFDEMVARITLARAWGRRVAVHCVGSAELALTLAALRRSWIGSR